MCTRSIEDASLADPEAGDELHAECLADRVLPDTLLAGFGLIALFPAPTIRRLGWLTAGPWFRLSSSPAPQPRLSAGRRDLAWRSSKPSG